MAVLQPWRAEARVNTTDGGADQFGARVVAASEAGPTVGASYNVVWTDTSGAYGSSSVLVARKFALDGSPAGGERILSGVDPASAAAVAPLGSSRFAVAYTSGGTDTYLARYIADSNPIDTIAIEIGSVTSSNPSVAGFPDAAAFVTYTAKNSDTDWDIVGRWVDPSGIASAPITLLDDLDYYSNYDHSQVIALANGNVAIVAESAWNAFDGSPINGTVHVQVRTPGGALLSSYVAPNGVNGHSEIAPLEGGGFALAYTRLFTRSGNIPGRVTEDVMLAVFDANGAIVRAPVSISRNNSVDPTDYASAEPQVTATQGGGFLVSWDSFGADLVQRFDATANAVTPAPYTAAFSSGNQHAGADVTTLADGRVAFAFDDQSSGNLDVTQSIWDARHITANMVTGGNLVGSAAGDILIERASSANNGSGGNKTLLALQTETNAHYATTIGTVGTEWAIDGVGNFGHDGYQDILIRAQHLYVSSTQFQLYDYQLTILKQGGNGAEQVINLGRIGLDTQVYGIGDFDGDGDSDVLVARYGSDPAIIRVENYAVAGIDTLPTLGAGRSIIGVGDVDRDRDAEILLQHDVDEFRYIEIVKMQGGSAQSPVEIGVIGSAWQIDGLGDFDGDGDQDVLIHRYDVNAQTVAIITLENGAVDKIATLGTIGQNTRIDALGDFDGDGDTDIALHYDQGGIRRSVVLEIQNSLSQGVHEVGSTGLEWLIT